MSKEKIEKEILDNSKFILDLFSMFDIQTEDENDKINVRNIKDMIKLLTYNNDRLIKEIADEHN